MRTDGVLGLYVHVPFCVSKCRYCDFISAPASQRERELYVNALCVQIKKIGQSMKRDGESRRADTIFIGGGTPSVLEPEQTEQIMAQLREAFVLEKNAEISIECNPGTIDAARLKAYKRAGINRLSLGLQSADNIELKNLGRIHTWGQFLEGYMLAREEGFENINVDLMSALPGQSVHSFEDTLKKVIALQPEHISVYSLIIEEGTPFFKLYEDGAGLPSEDEVLAMDAKAWELLKEAGYEHYEISNFARPGLECRHNLKYWRCLEYAGFGTGAASYLKDGSSNTYFRIKNIERTSDFIKVAEDGDCAAADCQRLDERDQMEEFAFLGLRLKRGVDLMAFRERFHADFCNIFAKPIEKYRKLGFITVTDGAVSLTKKAVEISNIIMADFLL